MTVMIIVIFKADRFGPVLLTNTGVVRILSGVHFCHKKVDDLSSRRP